MSLILTAFHDDMCVVTADSLVRVGEEVVEESAQKVFQLNGRVLYGLVGIEQGHDLILEALKGRISEHHDLEAVIRIIKKVCEELQEDEFFKMIIDKHAIGAFIVGFNKNHKAERYTLTGAKGSVTFERMRKASYGVLLPPGLERSASAELFEQSGGSVAEVLIATHSKFAYVLPEYVSQDCTLYAIQKDGKKYSSVKHSFDTQDLFGSLPTKEEVLATLLT